MQSQGKTCFDAILDRWIILDFVGRNGPYQAADGDIIDDSQRRWPNGTPVSTSRIMHQFTDDEGNKYIRTHNTTYKLGQSYEDWMKEQEQEQK